MSRYIIPLRLAAAVVLLLLAAVRPAGAQGNYGDNASYQQFYDELSPYGEWIDDPQNGYVWVPDAGDDFRPYYTNGYWANTDYGNTWVSDYNWGWAPFHYGRWTYNDYYGWVWIPGNEWGPAWVSWRSGGGSYGWAPLGPGISISMAIGNYYVPDYWWTFTPQQYILSPDFHQHCYGPRYNSNYVHQTTIINNTYVYNHNTYITGPRRNELEHATGRPVKVLAINNSTRPDRAQLQGNNLNIYRPAISESRPRSSERPRQFQATQRPITTAPREIDRSALRAPVTGRGQMTQPDRRLQVTDRPTRSGNEGAIQRQPTIDRGQVDRPAPQVDRPAPQVDRQPARNVDMQPQRSRPDWNSGNRMPDRTPAPQQPQPQRVDRAPMINRNMEQPRVQQAQPRVQQPQPVPQPRIERQPQMQRPQPVQQQPRVESPRVMPQRQEPAVQPQRTEQPAGENGGRSFRNR